MNELLDDENLKPKPVEKEHPLLSLRLLGGALAFWGFLWSIYSFSIFENWSLRSVFLLAFLSVWGLSLISVFTLHAYKDGRLWLYRSGIVMLTVVIIFFIFLQRFNSSGELPPYIAESLILMRYLLQALVMYLPVLLVVRYGRLRKRAADWWPTLERWTLLLIVLQIVENFALWYEWSGWTGANAHWVGYLLSLGGTLLLLILDLRGCSRATKLVLMGTWAGYHLILLSIYRAGQMTHVDELLVLGGLVLLLRTAGLAYRTQEALDNGLPSAYEDA